MKKDVIQQYHIRKVTRPNERRNTWNVNIPQEYVKILKLDQEYVQIQIIDDMIIIKKNKKSISKKDLEKIDFQDIPEETTAYTINNEIRETSDEEYDRKENEKISKILDNTEKEHTESEPTSEPTISEETSSKEPDTEINESSKHDDNKKEIDDILNEDFLDQLNQQDDSLSKIIDQIAEG